MGNTLLQQYIRNVVAIRNLQLTPAEKKRLMRWHYKLTLLYVWHGKLFKSKRTRINLFGFRLQFIDWNSFRFLFEEIFIGREYDFRFDAGTPFIIDCGSNIGMSIAFFKLRYPKAKVLGFEPDKDNFNALKNNVDVNMTDVVVHNSAVSDRRGTTEFYFKADENDSLTKTILKERLEHVPVSSYTVETVVLSDFISSPVDLLKIDVEGVEHVILNDLIQSRKISFVQKFIIEYHHFPGQTKTHLHDFLSKLEKEGFVFIIASHPFSGFLSEKLPDMQDIIIYAARKN